jgi:hypothetical protein
LGEFKKDIVTALAVTPNDIYASGRMKYYPNSEGLMELGSVDFFEGNGAFRHKGFESNDIWVADFVTTHIPKLDEVTYNPFTGQDVVKWGYMFKADKPPRNVPEKYDVASGTDKGRRRAMVKIFDYIRSNWDFDCMFTMTFDKSVIDRTSYEDIIKQVGQWLSNRVRRNGLKYIAVPEFHSDGSAIHLHGVCNFDALQTKYSRVRQGGKGVYNITDFPYGFTAVKKIGDGQSDRHAVAVYVSKYITKSSEKVGGRYFLHGGKLLKPVTRLCSLTREDAEAIAEVFPCKVFECGTPNGGRYVKYEIQHYKNGE